MKYLALLLMALSLIAFTRVDSSEVTRTEVTYKLSGSTKTKEVACYQRNPGITKTIDSELFFKDLKTKVRNLRKKRKQDPSNIKIQRRFKNNRKLFKAAKISCAETIELPVLTPSATPSPEPSIAPATPTPTPTPVGGIEEEGYYDIEGNVTQAGKKAFGISDELDADLITGSNIFKNYCTGCHEERRKTTFSELRLAISQDPMFYTEAFLPDDELANIMAYLSRFRSP